MTTRNAKRRLAAAPGGDGGEGCGGCGGSVFDADMNLVMLVNAAVWVVLPGYSTATKYSGLIEPLDGMLAEGSQIACDGAWGWGLGGCLVASSKHGAGLLPVRSC